MNKGFKRLLALLLTTAMVLNIGPMSTIVNALVDAVKAEAADGDTVYVLAGGDFQEAGDHANSAENVTNILAQISQKYTTMDGFLFIGDYDCETHNDATETANGITSLMDTVDNVYTNITDANSVLAQGNHDYMDSRIDATGGHDFKGYSAYVLNEDDYPNGGGSQSGIQALANNLRTWLNNKIGEGYSAPIFIVSHLPLAFTPRTVTQGDAKYAKYIFDVLNDAAANGLNIIFMHGHDHAYGPDNYMGGEAIYLAEGDKICIAEAGSTSAWTEETLNFTYMNAGYTGYYSDPYTYVTTAGTDKLTMTVFAITDNEVTVERYSANGQYNLKSAGYDGSYSNTSVTNVSLGLPTYSTVYTSPQTIKLEEAADYGATIGSYVGVTAETPADDVTTSGNNWVTITAPVPGNSGTDDVTTSGNSWVTITAPVPGTPATEASTTYKYVLDTDGVNTNTKYLIVNTRNDGTAYILTNNNGNVAATQVTISNGEIIISDETNVNWIFSGSTSGTVVNQGRYIYPNNGSISLNTSGSNLTISNEGSGEYQIYRRQNANYGYYYWVEYDNGWTGARSYSSGSRGSVYLFAYDSTITTPATDAIEDQNGLYGYVFGDLTYNFPVGTDADTAMAAVKAGIEVRYLEAMSTPGADVSYLVADDGIISWDWGETYNANTPGYYPVIISYNGVELGRVEVVLSSGDTNGEYAKINGTLSVEVAQGTSANDALAAVKNVVDGYTYAGMAGPGADVNGIKLDDSKLTWELDSKYNPNTPGDYAVTISYNGKTLGTAEVIVPASTTYYIAEGNGLYLVDMNTFADDAMAAVKAGVTVSSATDANGTNKEAISDDDVTWNWVDTYNGADSGPYTVEILKDGTSLGTVEVKVNIKYETGLVDGWTYIGESEATGGTHTYVLDTDGIDSDGQYIIVAEDQALALHTSGSSAATAVSVAISTDGKTLTTDTRDYEYYWNSTYGFTRDGYNGLYQSGYSIYLGEKSASYLDGVLNNGDGTYCLYDNEGTKRTLYYNGSKFTVSEESNYEDVSVRLYKYTGTTGGTPAGSIYAQIQGDTVYIVEQGTSAYEAMAKVKAGITGYISSNADGSNPTELEDSKLTWKWKNTYTSAVTGSYWVEISYNGKVLGTVEVKVEPGVIKNHPEYPDEGAVKVNKTATGIDFQSSGIARVELSASGVPIKKGVDVILMLDTSSSMTSHTVTGTSNTRAEVLEESLANLITQFKTPGDDGELLDIRVAIADFNGFYGDNQSVSGTAYDRDAADTMSDDIYYNAASEAKVYTGDGTLGAGAFVNVADLAATYTLNYTSGTNYDYAMDAIYQMGTAIKEANGSEDRDLYVIFMSDGAAMQWNYYHSQGASSLWNNWITGAWDTDALTTTNLNCTTHAYYYDEVDHNGDGMKNEHRMANAIKGDPTKTFEVIRKTNTLGVATNEANMYMVPGLGATMFSISFDAQADNKVTEESMDKSIASLASVQEGSTQYYYKVTSADELDAAFNVIGTEIAYAASNARFVDQIGNDFNLQLGSVTYTVVENGSTVDKTVVPTIEILTYDIYTRQDFLEGTITEDKIGDRKGTSTLNEVVMFNSDGTKAYSSLIDVDKDGTFGVTINADGTYSINDEDDNIFGTDGIIYAMTFIYNTTPTDIAVDGVKIPTDTKTDGTTTGSTNVLPSETFYWKIDTITTTELAMRYYVYLDGSMEGTRTAGSYATNEFAVLYYDNYLENPVYKDTVSPSVAWKSANVSYAFYLVNEKGEIIVNQTTGLTGSFANKIAVTNPVVYEEILLNNTDQVQSIDVAAISDDVLPKYYTLYDQNAVYEVTINSNSTGGWVITKGDDLTASTYVTDYSTENASAYSNAITCETIGYDYTHTTVWFAVVWKVQAHPDTVVIDYGLPVNISVMVNDMFGDYGELAGIGEYNAALEEITGGKTLQEGFGPNYTGKYGVAVADTQTGLVKYTPNTMEMNGYDRFSYAVQYKGSENAGYYYDTVTVIPATTIYYEDSFLTYSYTGIGPDGETAWGKEGTSAGEVTQDEDRPGRYSLTDANNIYGYDKINLPVSEYSMGTAMKASVDADSYATAEFVFCGTGFDIVSMTSSDTGVLVVQVYKTKGTEDISDDELATSKFVNTYYGVSWNGTEWVPVTDGVENTPNKIYQVPVIKVDNLDYSQYRVVLTASYYKNFDENYNAESAGNGYDLYIDAVRIYDPANDGAEDSDTVIENAYKADGESWPTYLELRNLLIDQGTFGNAATDTKVTGAIFIDGDADVGDDQMSDYIGYGPNNEVYLAPGDRVAFLLDLSSYVNAEGKSIVESVHIGIRSADGTPGSYTFSNIVREDRTEGDKQVKAGTYYNASTRTVATTTDMYYDLTGWKNDIIVISNYTADTGTTGCIAITNIKITFTDNPNGVATSSMDELMYMTPAFATMTLRSLNSVELEETPETEATESETPETEATESEAPETEATESEAPETEATESEAPETEATESEAPETEATESEAPETEATESETPETEGEENVVSLLKEVYKVVERFYGWVSNLMRR